MKRSMLVPAILVLAPAAHARSGARALRSPTQAAQTATLVLERDARGKLKTAPCARFDLSDPASFLSDDTVRAKRCQKTEPAKSSGKK